MEMRWKCLGRTWGVPSLFKNFLGIFPSKEYGFSLSYVHCSGASSIFLPVEWLTSGAIVAGSALSRCAIRRVQHYAVNCSPSLIVHVNRVHG
jgi:hypothetical protein